MIPVRSKNFDNYSLLVENLSKEKKKMDDGVVLVSGRD